MAIDKLNDEPEICLRVAFCICIVSEELRRRAAFFSNPPQGLSFRSYI